MTSGDQGGKYLHVAREDKLAVRTRDTEMVSRTGWNRIRSRILADLGDASSNWLSAGFAFLGIGASALLALLALPTVTTPGSELDPSVEPWLYTTAIFCAVLCVVFFGVHYGTMSRRKGVAQDIANEMDTMVPPEHLPAESPAQDEATPPQLPAPEADELDLLDDATLAIEALGPILQAIQEELRTAADMFSRSQQHGVYWSPTEGTPPMKTWRQNKDLLSGETTFQDIVPLLAQAFRDIERISRYRSLRLGGKVRASDSLPQAIASIQEADRAISQKLRSVEK